MPKFNIELTLYRTVEADDMDHAEAMADSQKEMVVRSSMLDDLGWEGSLMVVSPKET